MKKIIIVSLILIISILFFIKSWVHEIDEYGTKEINLVGAAGRNVCLSCIGLSDENIFEKIFGGSESDSGEPDKIKEVEE